MKKKPMVIARILRVTFPDPGATQEIVQGVLDKEKIPGDVKLSDLVVRQQIPIEESLRELALATVALSAQNPKTELCLNVKISWLTAGVSGSKVDIVPVVIIVSKGAFSPLRIDMRTLSDIEVPESFKRSLHDAVKIVYAENKPEEMPARESWVQYAVGVHGMMQIALLKYVNELVEEKFRSQEAEPKAPVQKEPPAYEWPEQPHDKKPTYH